MKVVAAGEHLYFYADSQWTGAMAVVRPLGGGNGTIVDCGALMEQASARERDGMQLVAAFHMLDFNAATSTLHLIKGEEVLDFSPALSVYVLDRGKLSEHRYVTINIFGHGARKLHGDDLLYLCLCYLREAPVEWEFYGGLVTVSAYRVAERRIDGGRVVDFLIERHGKYAEGYVVRHDHSLRWFISSSLNLATLLLYFERVDDAKAIVESALSRNIDNGVFPLTYMNYATMLLLAGVLEVDKGNPTAAYTLFTRCASLCCDAVPKLFTLRNHYILQHEMDVRVLTDIGYSAYKAASMLAPTSAKGAILFPGDSLMDSGAGRIVAGDVSFDIIAHRLYDITKSRPPVLGRAAQAIASLRK